MKLRAVASQISRAFGILPLKLKCYNKMPPSNSEALGSLERMGLPRVLYQSPYYSSEADVPERPREYAGREFKLESNTVRYLPDFDPSGEGSRTLRTTRHKVLCLPTLRAWELMEPPPTRQETDEWLEEQKSTQRNRGSDTDGDYDPQLSELSQVCIQLSCTLLQV